MIPTARCLLFVAALALADAAVGQEIVPTPRLAAPAAASGDDILPSLPHVPDLPASLFAPASPPSPRYDPLDVPYFMPDPVLDPAEFPPPGWFGGLEADVLKPRLKVFLEADTQVLTLLSAPLDWAVAPRAFLGYRLPAGFGEVAAAYRGLGTRGSEDIIGDDGPARLSSRLDFHMIDFDYSSREFSLWPLWEMKWTFGLRTTFLFFDSEVDQSLDQAAAGTGIVQRRETNRFVGLGPHAGVELSRRLADSGLSLVLRGDFATNVGRLHQEAFIESTTPGASAAVRVGEWTSAPILNVQAGLSWQPPSYPAAYFFVGYQCEYWWMVGRNPDLDANADLWDQGIVAQAAYRF